MPLRFYTGIYRYRESYEKYCECYKKHVDVVIRREESLYDEIMCHSIIEDSRKFRPFATFHDFYAFMNKENERLGKPEEYAKVMELLYKVDYKADQYMYDHKESYQIVRNDGR